MNRAELEATYITNKDGIFTPTYTEKDGDYIIVKTAEEVYQNYLNPVTPQPTQDEILRAKLIKDNASMQLQLAQQQKLNTDILLKLASLGGTANV